MSEERKGSRLPDRSTIAGLGAIATIGGMALGLRGGKILGRAENRREAQVDLETIVTRYAKIARNLQDVTRRVSPTIRPVLSESAAYYIGALEAHRFHARKNPRLLTKIDRAIQRFRSINR